jgi:hypothetical protein
MSISWTRVRAIFRKELREYRRNGFIISTMALIPLVFSLPPLIHVFTTRAPSAGLGHLLLYLLGIPAIAPASVAAYSVVGERQQGTLEPVLMTPVRREEFLLGKALAALVPSLAISYLVYGLIFAVVELFARPAVASAFIHGPELIALLLFTPLFACWSIWLGSAISSRSTDYRVAQQFSTFASLPPIACAALVAFNVIRPSLGLALGFAAALLLIEGVGWRITASYFDRERLVTGTRALPAPAWPAAVARPRCG